MKVTYILIIIFARATFAQEAFQVLSNAEEYPMLRTDYAIEDSKETCSCDSNATVTAWTNWSKCHGDVGSYECHNAIRYRRRTCSNRVENKCVATQWQHCYHKDTCTGKWLEWLDTTAIACSRTCGEGLQAQISICYKGSKMGLYCSSKERKPYKVTYTKCNIQPCQLDSSSNNHTKNCRDCATQQPTLAALESGSDFTPNHLTWTILGVGTLLLITLIATTFVCIRRKKLQLSLRIFDNTQIRTERESTNTNQFEVVTIVKRSNDKRYQTIPRPLLNQSDSVTSLSTISHYEQIPYDRTDAKGYYQQPKQLVPYVSQSSTISEYGKSPSNSDDPSDYYKRPRQPVPRAGPACATLQRDPKSVEEDPSEYYKKPRQASNITPLSADSHRNPQLTCLVDKHQQLSTTSMLCSGGNARYTNVSKINHDGSNDLAKTTEDMEKNGDVGIYTEFSESTNSLPEKLPSLSEIDCLHEEENLRSPIYDDVMGECTWTEEDATKKAAFLI